MALRELGRAIAAEAAAAARRNRVLALVADSASPVGSVSADRLIAGAHLRGLLTPAGAAARQEVDAAAQRRALAQQTAEQARARSGHIAEQVAESRHAGERAAERAADRPARRARP